MKMASLGAFSIFPRGKQYAAQWHKDGDLEGSQVDTAPEPESPRHAPQVQAIVLFPWMTGNTRAPVRADVFRRPSSQDGGHSDCQRSTLTARELGLPIARNRLH